MAFPAEPLRRPERSYRFCALGMRRWEVPAARIETLLALDLLVSGLRQMLSNHWHEANGFMGQLADASAAGVAAAASGLAAGIEEPRRPAPGASELGARLRTALEQQAQGLARTAGGSGASLRRVEQDLADFYRQHFERAGVDALVQRRAGEVSGSVDEAVRRLEIRLTGLWLDSTDPLPLGRIPQVLDELRARLQGEIAPSPDSAVRDDKRQQVMAARHLEWEKLTWLSARLTGQRRALIETHAANCARAHEADLHGRLAQLDRSFVQTFLDRLGNVKNRFLAVQQSLRHLLNRAEAERDLTDQELRNLHSDIAANRYELDPAALDAFLRWMRSHPEHQRGAAYLMREEIARFIGTNRPLSTLADTEIPGMEDRLRRLTREQAGRIHGDYETNRTGTPILEDSVLDILQARQADNPRAFLTEIGDFLGQAAVGLRLQADPQPSLLLGPDVGVPHMPKRLLLIGLPRHAFRQGFEAALRTATPAGQGGTLEVFEHDDPGQIRLLAVDYWLAARFSAVVHALDTRYQASSDPVRNAETLYFCNIDPHGEQGLRPGLTLPTEAEMRKLYEAELWAGQQPAIGAVQVDGNGVFLIHEDQDGRHAERLGGSLGDALEHPDYGRMVALDARLRERLGALGPEAFTALMNQRRAQIEGAHGLTSEEYRRWDAMLKLLKTLVI